MWITSLNGKRPRRDNGRGPEARCQLDVVAVAAGVLVDFSAELDDLFSDEPGLESEPDPLDPLDSALEPFEPFVFFPASRLSVR